MKKENIKDIIMFIILVISIIVLLIYNSSITKNKDIDRKIKYINGYSYDQILNKGKELYKDGINLIINKDYLNYEKEDNEYKKYSFKKNGNNYNGYYKILDSSLIKKTFMDDAYVQFMNYKDIVYNDNYYYIKNFKNIDTMLVGSILNIKNNDEKYVYIELTNYYCDNSKFIGYLDKQPDCNYHTNKTMLTYYLDDYMKIYNFEELKSII